MSNKNNKNNKNKKVEKKVVEQNAATPVQNEENIEQVAVNPEQVVVTSEENVAVSEQVVENVEQVNTNDVVINPDNIIITNQETLETPAVIPVEIMVSADNVQVVENAVDEQVAEEVKPQEIVDDSVSEEQQQTINVEQSQEEKKSLWAKVKEKFANTSLGKKIIARVGNKRVEVPENGILNASQVEVQQENQETEDSENGISMEEINAVNASNRGDNTAEATTQGGVSVRIPEKVKKVLKLAIPAVIIVIIGFSAWLGTVRKNNLKSDLTEINNNLKEVSAYVEEYEIVKPEKNNGTVTPLSSEEQSSFADKHFSDMFELIADLQAKANNGELNSSDIVAARESYEELIKKHTKAMTKAETAYNKSQTVEKGYEFDPLIKQVAGYNDTKKNIDKLAGFKSVQLLQNAGVSVQIGEGSAEGSAVKPEFEGSDLMKALNEQAEELNEIGKTLNVLQIGLGIRDVSAETVKGWMQDSELKECFNGGGSHSVTDVKQCVYNEEEKLLQIVFAEKHGGIVIANVTISPDSLRQNRSEAQVKASIKASFENNQAKVVVAENVAEKVGEGTIKIGGEDQSTRNVYVVIERQKSNKGGFNANTTYIVYNATAQASESADENSKPQVLQAKKGTNVSYVVDAKNPKPSDADIIKASLGSSIKITLPIEVEPEM